MPAALVNGQANGQAVQDGPLLNAAATPLLQPQPTAEELHAAAALYRKDANEVLIKDGPAALRKLVQSVEPFPVQGLFE